MIYFGIDVSKNKLDLCWLRKSSDHKIKTKVFTNSLQGFQSITRWVLSQTHGDMAQCIFTMEATGVYHEAVAYYLYDQGAEVHLAQPQQFHHFAKSYGVRSKTDKRDGYLLALYGHADRASLWQPEPKAVRQLKALLGRLEAVEQDIRRERNRQESVQISGVSDTVMASIEAMIEALEQQKMHINKEIDNHIDRHPDLKKDRTLLQSIPGVGRVVSHYMLSVLHSREFKCARECAAYLGMIPVMKESGKSVKTRPTLSKAGNSTVRAKLYMSAIVAIRHNPDSHLQYNRLIKRGKVKMSALGAVMRKLIHICFGVVKHQQEYVPQTA